jgi:integrase
MGCWVTKNKAGTLTFIIAWRGKKWWESAGVKDGDRTRAKVEALRVLIVESMEQGTFDQDYVRFFPHGNHIRRFERYRPAAGTFAAFADAIQAERKPPAVRHRYAKQLATHLKKWIRPALGKKPLESIRREDVIALQTKILSSAKPTKKTAATYSAKYARNIIGTLHMLLGEAKARKLISENPADGIAWQRQLRQKVDPFTRDEIEAILDYIAKKDWHAYVFILALADTGMRPGEAAGICWGEVDTKGDGLISIRSSVVDGKRAAPKTDKSERVLRPLSSRLRTVLADLKPLHVTPEMPVFLAASGRPIRQARVYERKWLPALRALGIRPRRMYQLRHSFISLALSDETRPAPPQWVCDYTGTSLDMLQKHYARYMPRSTTDPLAWLTGSTEAKVYRSAAASGGNLKGKERVSDGSRTERPSLTQPLRGRRK